MTTAQAPAPTLAEIVNKIGSLTALEPSLDEQYGEALLHGHNDVDAKLASLKQCREDLLALHAAKRQLEAERGKAYATKKTALTKRYHDAADSTDRKLNSLLDALRELNTVGAELNGLAAANNDSSAQFHRLAYSPGRVANIPSESLVQIFQRHDPWAVSRVSLSMKAQGAGLLKD
jgi:hypothetical protein